MEEIRFHLEERVGGLEEGESAALLVYLTRSKLI